MIFFTDCLTDAELKKWIIVANLNHKLETILMCNATSKLNRNFNNKSQIPSDIKLFTAKMFISNRKLYIFLIQKTKT